MRLEEGDFMAEKYGVVPKRFTHEWWEYFWMYYKWHTIVITFIVLAIGITVYQKATEPRYDTTLVYAGEAYISDESSDNLSKLLSPLTEDLDNNGEKALAFTSFVMSQDQSDPQYTMAMTMKLQLALSEDETYIYIMDEKLLRTYAGENSENCVFAKTDAWLKTDVPEDKLFTVHGDTVAVSLEGNKYLKEAGIDSAGKYLAVRFYPREDQKKQIPGYEAAVKLANKILQ